MSLWILINSHELEKLCPQLSLSLENVSEQLKDQGSEVQGNHKAIINDLADVRDKAQDIYHKIGKHNPE